MGSRTGTENKESEYPHGEKGKRMGGGDQSAEEASPPLCPSQLGGSPASLPHMGLIQVEGNLALLWLKIIASDNEIFVIGNSKRK